MTEVEAFITRWKGADGTELANAQSFTRELCDLLDVPVPDPARADTRDNAYVFERRVIFDSPDGSTSEGRIDCFKRGAFVLESKKLKQGQHTKGFDVAMLKAYKQAEQYIRALPAHEGRPPFLVVVDVGNIIELYSEFTCSGGTYTPFPDPSSHRIKLEQLRDDKVRQLLRTIWLDPLSLDPTKQSAKVTREIAAQLAEIAKSLELAGYEAERVGAFLTRCLFTFFAEDVGLLPNRSFTELLESLAKTPDQFVPMLEELWQAMDVGKFSVALRIDVLHFNGKLFKSPDVLPLNRDQIELLVQAGRKDWSQVEPAIFGTLLERALNPAERHKLGAHFTPRSYVDRLVLPTVIEPLREEWSTVQTTALTLASEEKLKEAEKVLRTFHFRLCNLRILDPACGSGNFLYVTLEHLKRLEGEVLNQLHDLNVSMSFETEGLTVDPHQFLGIELNPRAASIAEMVLWIGYLQWHFKTNGNVKPPQPVLRDFKNIECRDAVLSYDGVEALLDESGKPVTHWNGKTFKKHPITGEDVPDETAQAATLRYINPQKAEWPSADFVVGNPPFIGNKRMRTTLGDGYVDALRSAWDDIPETADFVMFWWHHAAKLVRKKETQRFGLITTNSLTMLFNRKIVGSHLKAKSPLSLIFAIPDHPWVDNVDGASVRIAMTVGISGQKEGKLKKVETEKTSSSVGTEVQLRTINGIIHSDLRVGANIAATAALKSNDGLSFMGVILVGGGFVLMKGDPLYQSKSGIVKKYLNGRDLTQKSRDCKIIDFFGYSESEAREFFPAEYQRILDRVKPEREHVKRASQRKEWWLFAEKRPSLRLAISNTKRYIGTTETAKHRTFMFINSECLPDQKIRVIAHDDAFILGVLSSKVHVIWALASGATLENRPVYNNTRCFEPFPFPIVCMEQKKNIRSLAEQLDTHRKQQQAQNPDLTLTGMYNVLEKIKNSETLNTKEKLIHEQGLVSVLKQLHDELDLAVLAAYGWSDLAPLMNIVSGNALPSEKSCEDVKRELEEALLIKLVDLNSVRMEEEKKGPIHWLRPEYQNPDSANSALSKQSDLDVGDRVVAVAPIKTKKQPWPKGDLEQVKAIADLIAGSKSALHLDAVAANFSGRGNWKKRLPNILDMLVVVGKARLDARGYMPV